MPESNEEHELESCYRVTQAPSFERENSKWEYKPTDFSVAEIFNEGETYELREYLASIENELEDQRISEETQQQNYAFRSSQIKKLEEAAQANAKQFYNNYINTHPDASDIAFKFSGRAFVKKNSNINLSQVFTQMLDSMIYSRSNTISQKEILESVKQSTGINELNANIWNMPLKKYMKTKLKTRIDAHSLGLSISSCKSMSDIRKTISIYYARLQTVKKVKLEVVITPNEVIANGTSYKLSIVNSGAYQYRKFRVLVKGKRTWLGLDQLNAFLGLLER